MLDLNGILSTYCDKLLGEGETSKKKKTKNIKIKNNCPLNIKHNSDSSNEQRQMKNITKSIDGEEKEIFLDEHTGNGFKILSNIEPDDSDVSLSDSDEISVCTKKKDDLDSIKTPQGCFKLNASKEAINNSLRETMQTDDGFKIVTDIPIDDSDISDAFDSDLSESECLDDDNGELNIDLQKHNVNKGENKSSEKAGHPKIKKPILKMIEDFGMQDRIQVNEDSVPCFITKSAISSKSSKLSSEEMKIYDYSKKKKREKKVLNLSNQNPKDEANSISKEETERAFKKAKYEIYKFGLSGFEKQDQRKAKVDVAMKLGARAPKKKRMNYKALMEDRKRIKQEELSKREEDRHLGLPVKKKKNEVKQKRAPGIGGSEPQIGKFKDGVLSLSKKDLERISK